MVHLFEIQFPLSMKAIRYCIDCLAIRFNKTADNPDFRKFQVNYNRITSFLRSAQNRNYSVLVYKNLEDLHIGVSQIMFIHQIVNSKSRFYIRLKIYPIELLEQGKSNNLLYCSLNNLAALQDVYAKAVMDIFPMTFGCPSPLNPKCIGSTARTKDNPEEYYNFLWSLSALPYLGLATVKRVDYALDLKAPEHLQHFLALCKRSILDKRKKASEQFKDFEFKNKTKTISIYKNIELSDSTERIIRFITTIRNPSNNWKKTHLHIKTDEDQLNHYGKARGGLLPFLNEELATKLLATEYDKLVGPGDFYSTYRAWKKIDESKYKNDKKQNMKELMQLISQCWSLQRAEQQYIVGTPLRKNRKIVKGTQQTFRKSIRQLRELGVQPLRIPDSWHLSHLHNPINDDVSRKIIFRSEPLNHLLSKDTFKKYEDTKTEIEKLLEARNIHE